MDIKLPHFANTLLFRISASFLLLMGISLGGYYLWIENVIFNPYQNKAEEHWFDDLSADELDSLATRLADVGRDSLSNDILKTYGGTVSPYNVEVVVFDPNGNYLYSTDPDSLKTALQTVNSRLLHDMSQDQWDFGTYPDSSEADAYINRIFDVNVIHSTDAATPVGYLVASYYPMSVVTTDLNADSRMINAQGNIVKVLMALLIYSAITALLIMAWTGRRVQRLSAGVGAFAAGNLSHRVRTRSTDEIGTLGRNFNDMAEHIETMVEKLRQKEQFQRRLIANVSHDLRTPMASMRGYVETLQMPDRQIDDRQKDRYLQIIAGNLDHLERLIEHMLILSRFDSGQATFQMETFPIVELADSILLRFEGLAAESGITLDLTVEGDVVLVHADPLQIAQVLQNLVENGIKFNRPNGTITISLVRHEQRVKIAVSDTGCGIPPADLPHIFDRFFTGDESRTRRSKDPDTPASNHHLGQSSGLGLSIAAKIVAGHNSMLRVESRPGNGTVFRFQLDHAQAGDQELSDGA